MAARLLIAAAALLSATLGVAAASPADAYNLYDPAPKCVADGLCPAEAHYSSPEERMMLTKINSLRFDPTLHITRNFDDDRVCALARTGGQVAANDPLFWRSDLAQAAKFHAWAMATSSTPCLQQDTCPDVCHLFDGSCAMHVRLARFHEFNDPRSVQQVVGKGDADSVLNMWIRSTDTCAVLFSRRHDTIGVGMWRADSGEQFWTVVISEAQPEQTHHRLTLSAGSHVPTDDNLKIRFLVHYYDRTTDEGLKEFAAVVDGTFHHLTRHRMDSARPEVHGRTGLYEDVVPIDPDDHSCHHYYFKFRTGSSAHEMRLPEKGVYWTTGVGDCKQVYSDEDVEQHPTPKFLREEEDVHEEHRPGYKKSGSFWQSYGMYLVLGAVAFALWRVRRRLNMHITAVLSGFSGDSARPRGPPVRP